MTTFERVRALCEEARYVEALALLDAAAFEDATILIWKAICAQLGDTKYTLADAERFLERAVEIEPASPEALFELASFHFNVKDDAKTALPLFERAVRAHGARLTETLAGTLQCLAETGGDGKAYLARAAKTLVDADAIKKRIG